MGGESHSPFVFDETEYSVSIDYNQSLEDMIKVAGKCSYYGINIIKAQITGKEGTVDVKLHFVYCLAPMVRNTEIEEFLAEMNLRPATLLELLAFGAKYPDKQHEFPIVALDSDWVNSVGHRSVPYLVKDGDKRSLCLDWDEPGDEWDGRCWFLAVSK